MFKKKKPTIKAYIDENGRLISICTDCSVDVEVKYVNDVDEIDEESNALIPIDEVE